jgi:L-asparaginase II
MRDHLDLLGGPIAADTRLARTVPGWVGKGGAEALFCARSDDGLAIALKVTDGSYRGILPALAWFLSRQGIEVGDLCVSTLENSRGEHVGAVRIR